MQTTFFLGTCTPDGFCAYPDALFRPGLQLTVIKGGSGCGKSTFMRTLAHEAERRGMDVVRLLCSSDPDSLDGIILDNAIAYVDGTAPHVLEPKLCGGQMNYLNFGEFYDRQAMRPNEEEILAVQKQNADCYPRVTACLQAAAALRCQAEAPAEELDSIAECLSLSTLRPAEEPGETHTLLCGVTPKGNLCLDETPQCHRIFVLRDSYQLSGRIMTFLHRRALALGHTCLVCHDPLAPRDAPQALLIPTAGTAFIRSGGTFQYEGREDCRIDLNSVLSVVQRRELAFVLETQAGLTARATEHMRRAKRLHDRLEQLCRPFVDFEAVDDLTAKTLVAIFGKK